MPVYLLFIMRIFFFLLLVVLYLAVDFYAFMAVRITLENTSPLVRRWLFSTYWVLSAGLLAGIFITSGMGLREMRIFFMASFFIMFMGKIFVSFFLLLDDLRRGITWLVNFFPQVESGFSTSRSAFLTKTALIGGTLPIVTLSYGIVSGAHDYRLRRKTIISPNLPKNFDGLRVAQISDIHTGSFFNKTAVQGGIDLLNAAHPDIAFFTGDLVNDESSEAKPYLDLFKKIKADLGVYSVMGNHDYGDYKNWSSPAAKQKDIQQLHDMHRYMGWDLLLNDNRSLEVGGESIGLLGCENWGKGRFAKYGDLEQTVKGSEAYPFKILLSHDPSHWDAQVRPDYPDIDLTLSGHTHGFQFGVEIGNFKWSPSQYIYKQWADLYQEGNQYLYVNRGYGFIGFPGRIGMPPEITILELKRG